MDFNEMMEASKKAAESATQETLTSRNKILENDNLNEIIEQLKKESVDEEEVNELIDIIDKHSENNEKLLEAVLKAKNLSKKIKDTVVNLLKK